MVQAVLRINARRSVGERATMMHAGHRHYYCSVPADPSTHDLHQTDSLGASLKAFRAQYGRAGHALARCMLSGRRRDERPGSVGRPCGFAPSLDDASAGGQSITIRPFLTVLTRETTEFSPASVPLRSHH